MPRPCCQKPLTKIIKVGTFEAGIVGLDSILQKLAERTSANEHDLANQLLSMVREHGNYISPATEDLYKAALLREFKLFVERGGEKK